MKYINSPLNYTGNKFKLLDQILPLFDYNKDYFVDLFCGGGSVYTNILDKYKKVLINDIISDLINTHKKLATSPHEFIESVKEFAKTKENQQLYVELRESYNKEKTPEKFYALILSCTNNMLRFNKLGNFNQTWGQREFNISTQKKLDVFVEHIQKYKDKIYYSSKNFYDIKIVKPSMVYCDPPYTSIQDKNGNIINKSISDAGYNSFFKKEDNIKLYEYLINLDKNNHSFMLSGLLTHDGKQSWIMNKLIKDGFNYKKLDFDYNNVSRKGNKESNEIIIMNY